jgi:hypothetical protein
MIKMLVRPRAEPEVVRRAAHEFKSQRSASIALFPDRGEFGHVRARFTRAYREPGTRERHKTKGSCRDRTDDDRSCYPAVEGSEKKSSKDFDCPGASTLIDAIF